MPFSDLVAEELLLRSHRHCCICHKFRGTAIEIHHIDPELTEGRDAMDNGIPLCFDCHAAVGSYNNQHPRGRKYRSGELRRLRDEWFAAVAQYGLQASASLAESTGGRPGIQQEVIGNSNVVAGGDLLVNTRKVVRVNFTPGLEHIAEATAVQIKGLVEELAALEQETKRPAREPYGKWWTKLKRQFAVTTYKAIPRERGEEAVAWLQQQKALLRPRLRRAAPSVWRNQLYAAIHARAKQVGLDEESLYDLARTRLERQLPVTSLKDLGERELKRLHQIIFSL